MSLEMSRYSAQKYKKFIKKCIRFKKKKFNTYLLEFYINGKSSTHCLKLIFKEIKHE